MDIIWISPAQNAGLEVFFKQRGPKFGRVLTDMAHHAGRVMSLVHRPLDSVVPMQTTAPRSPMMRWLPVPRDFRGDLRAALHGAKPTECLESLASLAACRLGFLETVQLDRALGRLGLKEAPGFLPIRLAILASSTVDHLSPAIRVSGLRRKLLIDVHSGGYGQYRQELLDPTSALHHFAPQAVLFSLTVRDAIAGVPLTATAAEADEAIA